MKCYSCGKDKPLFQDYRERDGTLSKYLSCDLCLHTADVDYFALADKTRNKQDSIGEVEITVRCKDVSSEDLLFMINKQLDDCDILPENPNVEVWTKAI